MQRDHLAPDPLTDGYGYYGLAGASPANAYAELTPSDMAGHWHIMVLKGCEITIIKRPVPAENVGFWLGAAGLTEPVNKWYTRPAAPTYDHPWGPAHTQAPEQHTNCSICYPLAPRTREACRVYFIQAGDHGLVKIGVAADVAHRLSALQTGSGERLRLLGAMPGGETEERALHRRFAALRVRGEWFWPSPDLLAFIVETCRA